MADKKITELTNITGVNLVDADEFVVVDISADETKAITLGELKNAFDTGSGFVRITGDTMTGALTTTGLTVDGTPVRINSTAPMLNFMETGVTDSNHRIRQNAGNLYFQKLSDDEGTSTTRMVIDGTGDIDFYAADGTTPAFHWDAADERLGIGTSSPAVPLHIDIGTDNNALYIQSSDQFANIGLIDGSGSGKIIMDSGELSFTTGGDATTSFTGSSERLRIDSSGNVGIGTGSPSESLTNRGNIFIETNSTSANSGNGLFWQSTTNGWATSTAHAAIYGKRTDASNGYLRFDTRQSGTTEEAMRISSSGSVGIGTTAPAFPLDISTNSSTTNDAVVVARISANTTGTAANNFGAALNFSGEDASGSLRDLATINAIYTNATNRSSALTFKTRENLGALTERMRIDSSGNVGIGGNPTVLGGQNYVTVHSPGSSTNIAGYDLYVSGTREASLISYPSNNEALRIAGLTNRPVTFHASNAERMRISSSGSVGIGTSSPATKLHIAGSSSVRNTIVSNVTLDGGNSVGNPYDGFGFGIDFIGRDYGNAVRNYSAIYSVMEAQSSSSGGGDAGFKAGLSFYTNGGGASGTTPTERMIISSSGSVGIGTSSPSAPLQVTQTPSDTVGDVGISLKDVNNAIEFGLRLDSASKDLHLDGYYSGAWHNRMTIDRSSGNVGIGTSSPSQKLHVEGAGNQFILLNNSTTNDGFYFKAGAGASSIQTNSGSHVMNFFTGGSEAMRIDSSQRLLLGTATEGSVDADNLTISGDNRVGMTIRSANSGSSRIYFSDGTSGAAEYVGYITYDHSDNHMRFGSAADEAFRIDASRNLLVGTTDNTLYNNTSGSGIMLAASGRIDVARVQDVCAILNRTGVSDGSIMDFKKNGATVGSIQTKDSRLFISGSQGSNPAGIYFGGGGDVLPASTTNAVDNSISLGGTGNRWKDLYLSGGVYLGGTGSANKLDDYEEGTWTPTAGAGTITVADTPTYTKVGRWVYLTAVVTMPAQTNSGQARITGLPFVPKQNGSNSEYGGSIGEHSYGSYIAMSVHSGYPAIIFRPNGGSSATYTAVSGKNFRFSIAYLTDQ